MHETRKLPTKRKKGNNLNKKFIYFGYLYFDPTLFTIWEKQFKIKCLKKLYIKRQFFTT